MPTVLITPELYIGTQAPYVEILKQAGFDIRYPRDRHFTRGLGTEEETIREFTGIAAVIAGGEYVTRNVLAASKDLRVVARAGVGFDRVDIPAATEHGVVVTITPTANHEAVAEHTLALLFAVAKHIVKNDTIVRQGKWLHELTGPIRGTTLGLFGLGRIGKSTAVRAKALGMTVIACETYPDEKFVRAHNIELVDFDALCARCDFLSIHSPLNDHTRGMFNKSVFAKMKPGSVLLNTSRGGLVVEADLAAALSSGHLGGAGLDVYETEPTSAGNPLYKFDNVVLSPHLAGTDSRSMEDMGIEAATCIAKLYRGQWPEGAAVNDALRANWRW